MNKTLGITLTLTLIASMTFASTGTLKNPNEIYPNKKPLISSKTPTAVSVSSDDVRSLKVRDARQLKVKNRISNSNSWPASHVHNGCHTKKVKAASSIDKPKRLRRFATKRGR
tara:strand:+ start:129 stop:467 length:339 start_codon:yes stop_codon:yes gene_type:complete